MPASPARPFSLYLAGPDVFRPDAVAHGERLKALCAEHGLQGLYPLDKAGPAHLSGRHLAAWIYRANIALIGRADGVLANLNPFRGAEPDSGTAFEVGYAIALGKPVWAYTSVESSIVEQVAVGKSADGHAHIDARGDTVEDFGMNLNLMLACSATVVVGDVAACLARVARDLASRS
ncbi:nucleoside 2-deoxyribosyltransferase [Bordetella bronchialis]|uniref:Nucleoside 2-deoxyribosyltransferase n=1 Tax=Bordetella bronchialis TaxID=463025 RepID=A0A193FS44_9BORD|nr:nucleoside 2-deoxyribosyltransferase [Bordetella bronchialis]ANN64976.1 nucleoside 2-deoxyribosyltransferase [Bordetella bronchialis]ANN70006.1 nucleoside 2-deoxyribosyltransferase [Bordetella bronchialis]